MYRTAVKRLLHGRSWISNPCQLQIPHLRLAANYSFSFSTSANAHPPLTNQSPTPIGSSQTQTGSYDAAGFEPSSSSTTSSTAEEDHKKEGRSTGGERRRPRVEYQEEQSRVLEAALRHVPKLGWTEGAMIAGARDVGISPSIVGSVPRKEATLVEFFMDDCLQKLIDNIDSREDLKHLIPSEHISKLVRLRLEMQIPYISKWPQALSIQAQPMNSPTSFKQRAMLVDEIWHAVGGEAFDIDWYVKRFVLGGIYSATEVYMLTDSSPDFRDTWTFLGNRIKDAFDLKKTVQEAQYLAEAVGAGMGNSLRGFMNSVFQGRR